MNAEEKRPDERRRSHRADQTHDDSDGGQPSRLLQDEQVDGTALGAERHADPDFTSSLAHRICNHTVESDNAQQQCQRGKTSHQPRR